MEEQNQKRFLAVSYQLYDAAQPETLIEEAPADHPFVFISGYGVTLEAFEKKIVELQEGEAFDFTLRQEEAYGPFMSERVVDLDREIFCINGHFDHDNVKVDAVLPLQNEDGNRFMGRVVEITDSHVRVDLNHPLAGKDLCFKGSIVENREPREAEIQQLIQMMSGECDCGCGGDCDHQHGDGCGHQHGDGCGCGHCH